MSDMKCAVCGKYGMYWKNITTLNAYTYCPHCGAINSSLPDLDDLPDDASISED